MGEELGQNEVMFHTSSPKETRCMAWQKAGGDDNNVTESHPQVWKYILWKVLNSLKTIQVGKYMLWSNSARYKITLRNQKDAKWVFWPWTWVILTTILPPPRLFNATILVSISPCLTTTWSSTLEAQRRALRDREKFEFHQNHAVGRGGRQHYWANKNKRRSHL